MKFTRSHLIFAVVVGAIAAVVVVSLLPGASEGCGSQWTSRVAQLTPGQLEQVVVQSGIANLIGSGSLDEAGQQVPGSAWTDNATLPALSRLSSNSSVPAGYEIRWWTRGLTHTVADVFQFRTGADASSWVASASSPGCHRAGASGRATQPAGARELVWRNPLGYVQTDVFFAVGTLGYRVDEVPRGGPTPSLATNAGAFATVGALACQIPRALCSAPSASPGLLAGVAAESFEHRA